jgi:hypothetical protein
MAWRMARARALKADSALRYHQYSRREVERAMGGVPVVVVLSTENVDMECSPRGDGEGVEDVGNHLGRKFADFFPLEVEVGDTVGARADVDDGAREGLVERGVGVSVALDSAHFAESLFEGGSEGDCGVLYGVVRLREQIKRRNKTYLRCGGRLSTSRPCT